MAGKPRLGELAKADHGVRLASAYTATLMDNPDSVLKERGRDMKIYDEILRDDQVKPTFQQRRLAVIQSEWTVEPASESSQDKAAAEFIKEQLTHIRFDGITDKMLYGLLYGYAVGECMWAYDGSRIVLDDIKVRDRSRFVFDVDGNLRLIKAGEPHPVKLPDQKFWVFSTGANHSDNPYGLGLGHYLYWPTFFKRNDIKFWLIFLEKFGQPTAMAKLPPGQAEDPREREKALQVLDAIQVDSGIVVPDNILVELLEAARHGTADYEALAERMDRAISKVVLSQTMTTDDGSSLSQAQVHEAVKQSVIKSDADLICESFNGQVVRWLTAWNFSNANPPRVWRNTEPEEDLLQRAERDNKISTLGYEPTEEYIEEVYGPGWRKKPEPMSQPIAPDNLDPAFAEQDASHPQLAQKKADRRNDQQALADAADYFATRYHALYGNQIEELLSYAGDTGDLQTFRSHLEELLEQSSSSDAAIKTIRDLGFYSRLMGIFRGEKR